MSHKRILSQFFWALGICFFGIAGQCSDPVGSRISASQTDCTPGQAQIAVLDGAFQNLCGCNESAGQFIYAPTVLSCTIPVGTVVFFYYKSTSIKHQIISVGNPSFNSSPPFDPSNITATGTFARKFETTGTYALQNAMISDMRGQIVVQ